jgi:uncharacterized repeat protein (TIGR02543 family)
MDILSCPQLIVSGCTLNISALASTNFNSVGINLKSGEILVCNSGSICASSSNGLFSYGINSGTNNGNIVVNDGYLEANAGTSSLSELASLGMTGITLTFINGTISSFGYHSAIYNSENEGRVTFDELSLIRVRNDISAPWEYIKTDGEFTDGDDWLFAEFATDFAAVMLEPDNGLPATEIYRFRSEFDELPTPTKEGCTFDGWYDGSTKITSISGLSGEVTLTAKWTENPNQKEPERPKDNSSYNSYPPAYTPGNTNEFKSKTGITSTVTVTEEGVAVEAGINKTGSVNSEATAAAVKKAAQIAKANGETSITIQIPETATGLSASTVQKLLKAAAGTEIVLSLTSITDGGKAGSITLPINSKTGQILTGLYFETKRIYTVQNYIKKNWDTSILGAFETAQKGGWGAEATLSISLEKLGFEADDGTKLYALIYDTKAKKWYQSNAEIIDGNVNIKTKRTGIITIVTDSVK